MFGAFPVCAVGSKTSPAMVLFKEKLKEPAFSNIIFSCGFSHQ
jgi:hypothetical protein